jgi:hypothetical protein
MLSAKADGAVATVKQEMPWVPERGRKVILGQSYQAEEAKRFDMEAFDRTSRKVGLLEGSVSRSGSK